MFYSGKCTWRKGTGADGEPVEVPVKDFLIIEEEKRLRPMATYFTQEDGKFYFVLPKRYDYKGSYVLSGLYIAYLKAEDESTQVTFRVFYERAI